MLQFPENSTSLDGIKMKRRKNKEYAFEIFIFLEKSFGSESQNEIR
jgi:hypothetical protein